MCWPLHVRASGFHAKERLRQQAIDLGGGLKDRASDVGTELKTEAGVMTETIKERSAQLAGAASDKVQEWTTHVEDVVRNAPIKPGRWRVNWNARHTTKMYVIASFLELPE